MKSSLLLLALLFLLAATAHAATVVISGVTVHHLEKKTAEVRRAGGVQVGLYASGTKDAYAVDTTSEDGVFTIVAPNVFTDVVYVRYEGDKYEATPIEVRLRGPGQLIQAKCPDLVLRPRNPDLSAASVKEIAAHLATVADARAFEAWIGLTDRKTANEAILLELLRVASSVGPEFPSAEILAEVRRLSRYARSLPVLDVEIEVDPEVTVGDQIHVVVEPILEPRGARPRRPLRVPPIPADALRSRLSSTSIVCKVTVELDGKASADCDDNPPDLPRFLIHRAKEMLEEAEWQPAMDEYGTPRLGRITVQLTWR